MTPHTFLDLSPRRAMAIDSDSDNQTNLSSKRDPTNQVARVQWIKPVKVVLELLLNVIRVVLGVQVKTVVDRVQVFQLVQTVLVVRDNRIQDSC